MENENLIVPFGGDTSAIDFSKEDWRKSYWDDSIDPKTGEPYGYRIKTDDGSVFVSKINNGRIKNGFEPI